jgi:hypothetical protein
MTTVRTAVSLNQAGLNAALRGPNGASYQAVLRKGNRVLSAARTRCPVDEGRLRASLALEMVEVAGVPAARIGSNLPYLKYVHDGTGIYGPHGTRIVPVSAKALRWPVKNNSGTGNRRYRGGSTIQYRFARSVKGVRGRPFLREALAASRD